MYQIMKKTKSIPIDLIFESKSFFLFFFRGKFATVRRATNKKTGVNFAAKFLKRRRRGQNLSKDIGHEIAVLLLCADSRNIVKLHGVHETKTETALLLEM